MSIDLTWLSDQQLAGLEQRVRTERGRRPLDRREIRAASRPGKGVHPELKPRVTSDYERLVAERHPTPVTEISELWDVELSTASRWLTRFGLRPTRQEADLLH